MRSDTQLNRFRAHYAALGMTQGDVASILGVTLNTFRLKMLNGDFRQGEIKKLIKLFNLSPVELYELFFGFDTEAKTE